MPGGWSTCATDGLLTPRCPREVSRYPAVRTASLGRAPRALVGSAATLPGGGSVHPRGSTKLPTFVAGPEPVYPVTIVAVCGDGAPDIDKRDGAPAGVSAYLEARIDGALS